MSYAVSEFISERANPYRKIGREIHDEIPVAICDGSKIAVAVTDELFNVGAIEVVFTATENRHVMSAGDGGVNKVGTNKAGPTEE
jgi:hypothetical protein